MPGSTRRWLTPLSAASLLTLWSLLPLRAAAEVPQAPRANVQVDEVRDVLEAAGYSVGYAVDWPDHTLMLDALASAHAVRVFIYPNSDTAAAAHRAAAASEPQDAMRPYSDDAGPQLLSGFGASAWRRNVALVASSPALFSELMPLATDCADVYAGLGLDLSLPAYRVDPTILRLLDAVP